MYIIYIIIKYWYILVSIILGILTILLINGSINAYRGMRQNSDNHKIHNVYSDTRVVTKINSTDKNYDDAKEIMTYTQRFLTRNIKDTTDIIEEKQTVYKYEHLVQIGDTLKNESLRPNTALRIYHENKIDLIEYLILLFLIILFFIGTFIAYKEENNHSK